MRNGIWIACSANSDEESHSREGAAHPRFALHDRVGFRGGEDILGRPAIMIWLMRMKPYVSGSPPMRLAHV